jgi:hypothetical protein
MISAGDDERRRGESCATQYSRFDGHAAEAAADHVLVALAIVGEVRASFHLLKNVLWCCEVEGVGQLSVVVENLPRR